MMWLYWLWDGCGRAVDGQWVGYTFLCINILYVYMSWGKIIYLSEHNEYKKNSLEDNVYYTLRDIFENTEDVNLCIQSNQFNTTLTGDVYFQDRESFFTYSNVLYDRNFLQKLSDWLNAIEPCKFEFNQLEKCEYPQVGKYMKFEDWWKQFEELRGRLNQQCKLLDKLR